MKEGVGSRNLNSKIKDGQSIVNKEIIVRKTNSSKSKELYFLKENPKIVTIDYQIEANETKNIKKENILPLFIII